MIPFLSFTAHFVSISKFDLLYDSMPYASASELYLTLTVVLNKWLLAKSAYVSAGTHLTPKFTSILAAGISSGITSVSASTFFSNSGFDWAALVASRNFFFTFPLRYSDLVTTELSVS